MSSWLAVSAVWKTSCWPSGWKRAPSATMRAADQPWNFGSSSGGTPRTRQIALTGNG